MIQYDRIKLVSGISNIEITDEAAFTVEYKDGDIVARKYLTVKPYLLEIKADYIRQESVIEFTGKILGKDYPQLISKQTICKCFEAINRSGFCHVDAESLMDADVLKCDVTKDIYVDDVPKLTRFLKGHIANYQKYVGRKMRNSNLTIEKNVTSRKLKKRLSIYDKENEMKIMENRQFAEDNGLVTAFEGKCRFEINLNSKEQVRSSLRIPNTKLKYVLEADANPILDFIDDVVGPAVGGVPVTDKKAYEAQLVLKDCDYDLEKVEAKMRSLCTCRGTSIKKVMEPYRAMMEQMGQTEGHDYWVAIRDQLM